MLGRAPKIAFTHARLCVELQLSVACMRRESAALSRIEKRLEEWRTIHTEAQEGGQSNPALVQLGQRIARLNAAIRYVHTLPWTAYFLKSLSAVDLPCQEASANVGRRAVPGI